MKRAMFCLAVLGLLTLGLVTLAVWPQAASAPASAPASADEPSVQVTAVAVVRGTVPDQLVAYGTAEPIPAGMTTVSQPRAGEILQLNVISGQATRRGDKLLDFGADPAGALAYTQAVSALALAKDERGHIQQLLAQQLATRAQLAQAEKTLSDAQAALDSLRREGGDKMVETLTSPFDGIVTAVAVGQGDRVQADATLLQLVRADGLAVTLGLEPAERGRVRPGEPVHLDPLDGNGSAIDGTIETVGGMLDPKTRLVNARVAIPPGSLFPGTAFRGAIETGRFEGWLTPRNAVLSDGKGPYVFQVAGNKAARVDVRVIGTSADTTVIDGALDPSRKLVVVGNYQLRDGATVREAEAPLGEQHAEHASEQP